jgi:hypothetical protein
MDTSNELSVQMPKSVRINARSQAYRKFVGVVIPVDGKKNRHEGRIGKLDPERQ